MFILSARCVGRNRCFVDVAPNADCHFVPTAEEQKMSVVAGLKKVTLMAKTVICLTTIPVMKMKVDPFHNVNDVVDTLTIEPVPNVEVLWSISREPCIAHPGF